ncbi:MAG: hypothetical protein IT281_05070 [Ignavibacteria bacterium]|nr:hypothetical protein [Ignavibacteria bacterium]MCC7158890.1 hypothetical protein [Ignavibacteria bacterium]
MNYKIIATRNFEKQLKRLSRKFPSLKDDLRKFEQKLTENPKMGISLGRNAYKVRLAVKSKAKGKSGGFRIITYIELNIVINDLSNIFLLSIYDKSETESISNSELRKLIDNKLV